MPWFPIIYVEYEIRQSLFPLSAMTTLSSCDGHPFFFVPLLLSTYYINPNERYTPSQKVGVRVGILEVGVGVVGVGLEVQIEVWVGVCWCWG